MLKSCMVAALAAVCVFSGVAARGQEEDPLAAVLPADSTVVFVRLDLPRTLAQMEKAFSFVDAEAGERIVYQVGVLHEILIEAAANQEFSPVLLERLADIQPYFVMIAKDEPEVRELVGRRRPFDEETGQPDFENWQEFTYTETSRFTNALVIDTGDEETAAGFLTEIKALIDREQERNPGMPYFERVDVEVEAGELISDAGGNVFAGWLGSRFVLSNSNPEELWAAMLAPPDESVADTDAYRRLVEAEQMPLGLALVNAGRLLSIADAALTDAAEEARRAFQEQVGEKPRGDWDRDERSAYRQMEAAQQTLGMFQAASQALSFDQWDRLSASFYSETSDEGTVGGGLVSFTHGEAMSAIMQELLDGSGSFNPPDVGERKGACVMARVSAARIYEGVVASIQASNPQNAMRFAMGMALMKGQFGADLNDILGMLAGDCYVLIDVVRKEHEVSEMVFEEGDERPRFVTETRIGPVPDVLLLSGLEDPTAARELISRIVTALGGNPLFAQMCSKRPYQGEEIVCFGANAGDLEVYPDGLTSFALVVTGRFLTIGSWERVTAMVRSSGGTDTELAAVVDANPDANFLAVIPAAFSKRMAEMVRDDDQEEAGLRMLLHGLETADLGLDDEDLEQRLKASLRELIEAADEIGDKADLLNRETVVISGTHRDGAYDVETETALRR